MTVTTPVDSNSANNFVVERAVAGTRVGLKVLSSDSDGFPLTYSLLGDSSGGGFTIDPNTGVVSVADPNKITVANSWSGSGAFYVLVQASDGHSSSSLNFRIDIVPSGLPPTTPTDSDAATNLVAANAAVGTPVGLTVSSSDPEGAPVTYSLLGDTSQGGFRVDASTGVVTVADPSKISVANSWSGSGAFYILVQASDGHSSSSLVFRIDIASPELAPTTPVDSNVATNTVTEGAAVGTPVGVTVSASDTNGAPITYSLTGSVNGAFQIDPVTGVVSVADSSKIDYENSGATYTITAVASNSSGTSAPQIFHIGVNDAAPTVPTDGNPATNTVTEGAAVGTLVGVTVSASDVNGPAVQYLLTGSVNGTFKIDPVTGVVSVADSNKVDFENSGGSYTVTAVAFDGTLTSAPQTFTIAVNDVAPTAPTDGNLATNTVAEGAAAGTLVGVTASASDINGPAVRYLLTGSVNGAFKIDPVTGVVSVADSSKVDFESSGHSYTITAVAFDGTLTSAPQTFTIAVTDVAPGLPPGGSGIGSVFEGAVNGTPVAHSSATDVNGGALTYSLTADSSNGGFAINASTGVVTVADTSKIDYESAPGHGYTVTVSASDGTLSTPENISIAVLDVAPSTPTDSDTLTANSVLEGAANGTAVGITASSTDPGGGPAATFSLTDSAGGRFAIDATTGVVTVANGAAIDYETAPGHAYGITVQATAGALSSTQNFSIGVGNVNEAPAGTDKTLTMLENSSYVFGVADFGFTDPSDSSAPNSLLAVKMTTVPGAGAGTFTNNGNPVNAGDSISATDIAAGHLVFTPTPHANGSPEAAFTFQVQDDGGTANGGVDLDQSPNSFTINVSAVNDAPVNSVPGAQSVDEDTTLVFSAGTGNAITISDVDVGSGNETVTLTVASGTLALGSTAGLTSFTDHAASITLTGTVANVNAAMNGLNYTGNLNFNGTDTLVVTTNDNGNTGAGGPQTDTDNVTINVAPVNDNPVDSVPGSQTVNEDTALVFSAANFNAISISDVDANGGDETVTLVVGSGTLALGSTLNLTSFTNNAASIMLTGTVAHINTALDGLTYQGNLNFNGLDSLSISTYDNGNTGSGGPKSGFGFVAIDVTPVNDAPVVTAGHTLNYTENQAATALDPAITVSDVDSANLASATVQISGNYVNGEDVLGFTDQNGITGSFDAATGTLTLTGPASVANYQAALDSVTYVNTSDNPSGLARTVTIVTNDGAADSIAVTDTINVTPVNDAPVVTAGHTLNYTENQIATAIDPALTVTDVDSANLASATVQITGNYVNGEDVLGFTDQNGITGSFDAATGTLTLNGSSSVANYQTALDSVTYVNTSDNPSGLARTVTIITNDGAANSVAATDTINVTPVNDAPVATAGHTLSYTENQVATAIDPAITVSDVDSANLASATVQISANYVNGQDILGFTTQNGITGVFSAATGTMTLTGPSSVANYQAALDSVTYFNNSDDPSGATRTVTIVTNDGAADSVAVTDTITVTPVNDAPTLTATGNNPNYSNGVDLFSAVTASTVEAGQLLDQLKLTVTNISGTATDSLTIDGTTVALTNDNGGTSVNGAGFSVEVSGTTATVTIKNTPALSAAAMAALVDGISYTDTNVNPGDPARVVTITQLHDTGGTANGGVDTTVLNITSTVFFDQAPVVTAGHTLNYTENQAATAIDPAVTVTDSDNATLAHATVQITGNYVNGEDVLGFTNQNGIAGSFNAANGTLTLTGSSTVAHYQTALASVTYVNTSDNPSGAARTVTITANDGALNSTPVTDTINVTPVNDAPVVTAGHTLNYTENQAATAFDPALTVTDVDNANLASATVQITGNYANGQDVLGFTTQNGITGSFNAATGTLTLTGSSSVANYQTALDSVTYVNTSENPSGLARTVTIIANDGAANSIAATDTINVTPVNDAPVTSAGGTLNYTENQVATAIDPSVTVSDVDNTNLASATVQITGNYVNGEDILSFTTQNGITGVFSAATGTMTLTGPSSVANYQTALESVKYFDNSDNPSGLDRTVSYTANDGALNSNTSTSTIHVTPVNDAPVVNATGTLAYTENQAATAIAPALTVTDVDTATLTTASVQISANYVNGEDLLAFANTANITGSFNAATGIMTLTGTDTVANYQAALRTVTYADTSENPSTAARTVTFTADDGQSANHLSAGSNHTITVASVDDAPTVTVPGAQDSVSAHTDTAITGISTNDVDAGALAVKVSLGTSHGNITLDLSGGATLADATTNGTHSVHITGTLTQVNAALSSLVYHGDAGFTGADALTVQTDDLGHTGTGGPLTSSVATVNIGVIPKVWFIDNTASAVGENGSQAHPFHSIAAFNAVNDGGASHPQTGDYIYLKTGTGIYSETDGVHLLNGQQLVGGGDGLTFTDPLNNANTLTIETAGTRPVIDVTGGAGNDAIHLAQDNTIHGFNLAMENAAATGIADNGGTVGTLNISNMDVGVDPDGAGALLGNLGQAINITHGGTGGSVTLGTVSSSGGTTGIALGGALATNFSATSGTLSGHSTSEFSSNGGSGTVSYGGAINDGSGTTSVSIVNRTGGTVTLSGNITDGNDTGGGIGVSGNASTTINFTGATKTLDTGIGDGVSITSNTGSTVNFTNGGLTVQTTNGTGFQDTVSGTVSVTGTGNTISTTGTGTGLNLSHVTIGAGGVTFDSVSTNGAANGIVIDTVTGGAVNVNGGSIAGASANGVNINAAQDNITIASSIASTSAGHSVQVTNSGKVGGNTIAFSGSITDPGLGINLDNNDQNTNGATINFTGALNIDSTTNTGFNATNGGTVNASNAANSITTTTGTALNVNGTNIGSSNLIFHDISSSGGSNNGINLVNTGTAAGNGGLHVTGTGTTAGSGGTIANKSGADGSTTQGTGIFLNGTKDVQLADMQLNGFSNFAIRGNNVTGFTLDHSVINGDNGSSNSVSDGVASFANVGEDAVRFTNLLGSGSITNSTISGGYTNTIMVENNTGTLNRLTIDHSTIGGRTDNGTGMNDGINFQTDAGSTAMNLTVTNTALTTARAALIAVTNQVGTNTDVVFDNNTLTNNHPLTVSGGPGLDFAGLGNMTFDISNNTFDMHAANGGLGIKSNVITVDKGTGSTGSTFDGTIAGNTVGVSGVAHSGTGIGADGIAITSQDTGTFNVLVKNNTIYHYDEAGISILDVAGSSTVNATVIGNTTSQGDTDAFAGLWVVSGSGLATDTGIVNVKVGGSLAAEKNDFSNGDPANGSDVYLQGSNTAVINLTGTPATNNASQAAVATVIQANNLNPGTTSVAINPIVNIVTTSPPLPMLAAPGGVQALSPNLSEMHLTQSELDWVVAAAIGQWAAAGASATQLAALNATTFSVDDLSGTTIGQESSPAHITIDTDAAGHGWFIDPTPSDNSEFTHAANAAGTDLYTDPTNAAAGHLDLLTTVSHELGHVLGLPDSTSPNDVNDLMYVSLVDGERRLPDAADVAQADPNPPAASLPPVQTPNVSIGPADAPVVMGTPGNDTLDAGHGGNILVGGAGADTFVFANIDLHTATAAPPAITHVADYSAAQGDTFDFSALTAQYHPWYIDDASLVRAVEDPSGGFATLQVNTSKDILAPGGPTGASLLSSNWVSIAQIDGAQAGDAVNVTVDSHLAVHLAQIHVNLLA